MTKTIFSNVKLVGKATVFLVGLTVTLALTVGLASAAVAGTGVGAQLNLGKTNAVNAITELVGSVAGPSLQIENNSTTANATALDLRVRPGKAPMKVHSQAKVNNLNSDTVDGRSANQLARVASFSGPSPLPTGADGRVATTGITAPAPGFLVIDANANVINLSESDLVACSIEVDNDFASGSGRQIELNANNFVNRREICSTSTVVPVAEGTHTVDMEAQVLGANTRFLNIGLSAIYIPFNGSGAPPSSDAISSTLEEPELREESQNR